jgi:hypothetical protein
MKVLSEAEKQEIIKKDKILAEISLCRGRLFASWDCDLNSTRGNLISLLDEVKDLISDGKDIPPLLLLEIFLYSHAEQLRPLSFVQDWLYKGALGFHQAEGKEHFERGLGFTATPGKYSGQGHEFTTARREQRLERSRLYHWILFLNKFEGYNVNQAVDLVHTLHEKMLYQRVNKGPRGYRNPLTREVLEKEYKQWKGKRGIVAEIDKYFDAWQKDREKWIELFERLKSEGYDLPSPKKTRKKIV